MAFGKCDSCATLRGQVVALETMYGDLLEKYHALRVAGANPEQERRGLAPVSRSLKPADEAIETIVARFGNNPLLRKRLQRYVNLQRQRNVEDATIAESVLHWSDPDAEEEVA